jgi:hypothetical protein
MEPVCGLRSAREITGYHGDRLSQHARYATLKPSLQLHSTRNWLFSARALSTPLFACADSRTAYSAATSSSSHTKGAQVEQGAVNALAAAREACALNAPIYGEHEELVALRLVIARTNRRTLLSETRVVSLLLPPWGYRKVTADISGVRCLVPSTIDCRLAHDT